MYLTSDLIHKGIELLLLENARTCIVNLAAYKVRKFRVFAKVLRTY